jgi:hypothetical protein
MSFLSPRLHPFFLILLSYQLSALRSFDTLLDLFASLIVLCLQRISGQPYPKEYTILKHGLFVQNFVISIYAKRWFWLLYYRDHVLYKHGSRKRYLAAKDKVNVLWYLQFFYPCWMSRVFFAQHYWSSSCALLHLRFEFISWLTILN